MERTSTNEAHSTSTTTPPKKFNKLSVRERTSSSAPRVFHTQASSDSCRFQNSSRSVAHTDMITLYSSTKGLSMVVNCLRERENNVRQNTTKSSEAERQSGNQDPTTRKKNETKIITRRKVVIVRTGKTTVQCQQAMAARASAYRKTPMRNTEQSSLRNTCGYLPTCRADGNQRCGCAAGPFRARLVSGRTAQ